VNWQGKEVKYVPASCSHICGGLRKRTAGPDKFQVRVAGALFNRALWRFSGVGTRPAMGNFRKFVRHKLHSRN
jgi:hypothetical protein